MSEITPLEQAFEIVGNAAQLAYKLGILPWAVYKWDIERPPRERCLAIQELTKDVVTAEELRPDVNWDYEREHRKFSKPLPIAKKTTLPTA